jgi:hypothetical protein
VTDPAAQDGFVRALAYAHPLWMLASIALAALALRSGLALRSARRRGVRRRPEELRRHLALAKPAIAFVAIGFLGGPLSMAFLRGREPFATAHGWIGMTALALFVAAFVLGRRLEQGRGRPLDAHAALATLAVLAAAAAALTGFVLLP